MNVLNSKRLLRFAFAASHVASLQVRHTRHLSSLNAIPKSLINNLLPKFSVDKFQVAEKVNGVYVSPWGPTSKKFSDRLKYILSMKQMKLKFKSLPDTSVLLKSEAVDMSRVLSTSKPHVTWMGHATCLYQTEGTFFLTDPLWSDRASPSQLLGPKRFIAPPVEVEDLKVDVVLLSHTHYDHLDQGSAQRIGNKALWIVPLGVKEILEGYGITNCVELNWWQSYTHKSATTGKEIEIIFTPTKHWTARTAFDTNTCLWGSFAVRSAENSFFFTGDTAYSPLFKQIGEEFGPFDFAAIPIGAYAPRWFMYDAHCNPAEAVQIHQDLRAKRSFGIHWGTFPMADEDFIEPALELARTRELAGVKSSDFFTMRHGETLCQDEKAENDFATTHPEIYQEYLTMPRAE